MFQGSGKSFLGKEIHARTVNGDPKDHIFSADDYFMTSSGYYRFDATKLPDAHQDTQKRCSEAAQKGWSPLIIDNTNVRNWELHDYVRTAVSNNYHIEIMEPCTTWCKNVSLLANLNKHNVPKAAIARMLDNWENVSLDQILRELNINWKSILKRTFPPIITKIPFNTELETSLNLSCIPKLSSNNWNEKPPIPERSLMQSIQNFQMNESNAWAPELMQFTNQPVSI